jgi:3-hydroxyacyl-CoA dehydrogenase/enoyl-CoA hydratase/3-hydroxybutyryl-CoA epimerase
MILTGKSLSAQESLRRGLIDELVHPSILDAVALKVAEQMVTGWRPKRRRVGFAALAVDRNPLGRKAVIAKARKTVLAKTGDHYPAPLAALEAVEHGLHYGLAAGLEHEAAHFSELAVGDVSKNLVQIFFAGTALKKDHRVACDRPAPHPIANVAIVGAGFMGSAIAGVAAATTGVDVRLKDTDLNRVAKGLDGARGHLRDRVRKNRITKYEFRRLESLLSGGTDWAGFQRADLVVEAVPEDLKLKKRVLDEIESNVRSDCIIASNTSTIPISRIAEAVQNPHRVVGMHFFSPVAKMPLVEVVAHGQTDPSVVAAVASFGRGMHKTVLVVKDSPGFWVNRILAPYLRETWLLLEEGVEADVLDSAMTEFGFPVGPVTLLDEIGLDVILESSQALYETFGERMKPLDGVARMVNEGRLGRKSGRGLFQYRRGKKHRFDVSAYEHIGVRECHPTSDDDITRRLIFSMLNEAARAVEEGVVRSPRDGDIGAIYGVGFPPFRGGPLRYLDHLGAADVSATLDELAERYGDRFSPTPSLVQMAKQNDRFFQPKSSMEH